MTLIRAAADLLLGAVCPSCGTPGWGACRVCVSMIRIYPHPVSRHPPRGLPSFVTWTATSYEPPIASLIVAYKDRKATMLANLLAECLAVSIIGFLDGCASASEVLLVPVPSTSTAVQERGFDHLELVVRKAARLCDLPHARLLKRTRRLGDQVRRGALERWMVQQNTMAACGGSHRIVVVDDVLTTGATLQEATRALEAEGHDVIGRAVIAEAVRGN